MEYRGPRLGLGSYVVHSMVCFSGTSGEQWCFTGYAGGSGVALRCLATTG